MKTEEMENIEEAKYSGNSVFLLIFLAKYNIINHIKKADDFQYFERREKDGK